MANWRQLALSALLADGHIDAREVEIIRKEFYADRRIDRGELEFLLEARRKAAERRREAELERQVRARWDAMTPSEQESFDAEALAHCDPEARESYEATGYDPAKRLLMTSIRHTRLRQLIESEATRH